jgi:arsenite methyltransferase
VFKERIMTDTACCGPTCCAPEGKGIKEAVQAKYSAAARSVTSSHKASCCSTAKQDPITSDLYDDAEKSGLPAEAVLASLGCGNPTALAELSAGEVVLDLGSGGGIDVLLSARRVGPTGKAFGLDMTDDMLELARSNQRKAGVQNVEFLRGEIENIPLPNNSVDVVISNCVINLSADKPRVLAEAFRVLKPGGRFAVSDIVRRGDVPEAIARSMELWTGCIAGALHEEEYRDLLKDVGFAEVGIEPTRVYRAEDAKAFVPEGTDLSGVDGTFMSAFVRARKVVSG